MSKIEAPFSQKVVETINNFQRLDNFHPLTCGSGNRKGHADGEGILVATKDGLICPFCDYKQNWIPEIIIEMMEDRT